MASHVKFGPRSYQDLGRHKHHGEISAFLVRSRQSLQDLANLGEMTKISWQKFCMGYNLRWFPSKRSRHRFPMKLGMLMLQDKEILKA